VRQLGVLRVHWISAENPRVHSCALAYRPRSTTHQGPRKVVFNLRSAKKEALLVCRAERWIAVSALNRGSSAGKCVRWKAVHVMAGFCFDGAQDDEDEQRRPRTRAITSKNKRYDPATQLSESADWDETRPI